MATLEDLNNGIYNKLVGWSTYDPSVKVDELQHIKSDIEFPRIEIDTVKFKGSGYISQREIQWDVYFRIVGYLQKDIPDGQQDSEWTISDRLAINMFGIRTVNRIYTLHDDYQAGVWTCPGFLQFDGFPEVWVNFELGTPGRSSFACGLQAKIILTDTEE